MLSLSTSKLEKFRRYVHTVTDYDTAENLIDTLEGKFVPSYKSTFGQAYHAVIENPDKYYDPILELWRVPTERADELPEGSPIPKHFDFNYDMMEAALKYREFIPGAFFEIPSSITLIVGDYEVTLSLRIDVQWRNEIHDMKCSFRPPEWKAAYMDSMQWRVYLLATGLSTFYYVYFQISELKEWTRIQLLDPPMMLVAYPDMENDVKEMISGLITWCQRNGKMHLLEPKQKVVIEDLF